MQAPKAQGDEPRGLLEHRGIAGETYRRDHDVESLFTLVERGDVAGVDAANADLVAADAELAAVEAARLP